jgi:HEPN domain-containing protein
MPARASKHDKKASEQLARAAYHHGKAAELGETGRYETALQHAQTARTHSLQASIQAEKALQAHVEHIHLLMHEADHRAKNMLNLVQTIARLTAASDPENFLRSFTERIQALANQSEFTGPERAEGSCCNRSHMRPVGALGKSYRGSDRAARREESASKSGRL